MANQLLNRATSTKIPSPVFKSAKASMSPVADNCPRWRPPTSAWKSHHLSTVRTVAAASAKPDSDKPEVVLNKEFGYSRKDITLIGVGLFALGYAMYYGLQATGMEPGMAGNWVQLLVTVGLCVGWISTYLFRVATKQMTYVKQLEQYEDAVMRKRLEEMTPQELTDLTRLLAALLAGGPALAWLGHWGRHEIRGSQTLMALQLGSVLMVTDFFYPSFGGVENHVYQLSQCLIAAGYKVVVLTHAYDDCAGVRYLTNGLKVYYLHRKPVYLQTTLPTFVGAMRMLRLVLLRERITLVHAHQAFSTLGLEACLQARTMGYKVVFTDHSLFGFADAASILMNKLLKCVLADINHAVCVSHTSKENTVLRACLPPQAVSVIPNAVDAGPGGFQPAPAASASWPRRAGQDPVTLVALNRLVYRKGVDLLALALPYVCRKHPNLRVVIGGGGPKMRLLQLMVQEHGLHDRVVLAGPVPCEEAARFLQQGHVFVNASLTEAFCMAIVEAAACGLTVVSTRVGGVPEVLPPDMMELAEPSAGGLCQAIDRALQRVLMAQPEEQHRRCSGTPSPDPCMAPSKCSQSKRLQELGNTPKALENGPEKALHKVAASCSPGLHASQRVDVLPGRASA
ncbi:hypothetical protein QJQ45_023357 [Haematococcus lacustris]|nr:hypothetical protein QJQ45_023357 [Haematococcus lacustris]